MYKVLIIGCGNIGAMYDWESNQILTHAKAFSKVQNVEMFFYDINWERALRVSKHYHGTAVENLEESIENMKFDIISICTPTHFHYDLLKHSIKNNTPVIICEKPVSVDLNEINQLRTFFHPSNSKIIVNYIRRFQPSYLKLKDFITFLLDKDKLTNISIRYQRGFMNNCSHAFDLLQFLFQEPFNPSNFLIIQKSYDHFQSDPTLSGTCKWLNADINVMGLFDVEYSHFEIDLYFRKHKIVICNSGDVIESFSAEQNTNNIVSLLPIHSMSMQNCVSDYMAPVAQKALSLLNGEGCDNFLEALELNQTIMNILNE